jgi:hypothetical protein
MRISVAALALLAATPAVAQDEPRFCPNRPDLGASSCTTDPGRVLVEYSALDWQRSDGGGEREDQLLAGDLLIRTGLDSRTEMQVSGILYGHLRARGAGGAVRVDRGIGDIRLAVRRNVLRPDGAALSIAVEPFVTLPVGARGIGAGDWSAGVVLPVNYDLGAGWRAGFTGTAHAAVDDDGDGRHFSANGALGLGYAISDRVGVTGEISVTREEDPFDPRTETVTAASIAWQPLDRLQFDLLAVVGLTRTAPDLRLVAGGAILF